LIEATISTEDNSFWDHPGVNIRGLLRAAYENYVKDDFGSGTGGSSITQQLIKNVYICPSISEDGDARSACALAERTLDRKLKEIAFAIELEQDYTKEEILTWYLNQISYADRYIGAEAAAQGYFQKPASDLTLAESALLAGIPQVSPPPQLPARRQRPMHCRCARKGHRRWRRERPPGGRARPHGTARAADARPGAGREIRGDLRLPFLKPPARRSLRR
ncbi:MAG TPA: biosynthetic peptidoglycan transglycosylase, partial [Tepidiformaceae bacterium]|nr:biosynthetic peptidoglycan transglycosylase [Tepidiformaceae bacterium]